MVLFLRHRGPPADDNTGFAHYHTPDDVALLFIDYQGLDEQITPTARTPCSDAQDVSVKWSRAGITPVLQRVNLPDRVMLPTCFQDVKVTNISSRHLKPAGLYIPIIPYRNSL